MKNEIVNFTAIGILGIGLANVSTLIVRYFPAVADAFYFITSFLLACVAIALVFASGYKIATGSHEVFFKVITITGPPLFLILVGVILGLN